MAQDKKIAHIYVGLKANKREGRKKRNKRRHRGREVALRQNRENAGASGDVESTINKHGGRDPCKVMEIDVRLQVTAGWWAVVKTCSGSGEEVES